MEKKRKRKVLWCVGSVFLTVIGFVVIPVIISRYGNKVYKSSLKREQINFDDLGPEIVKKEEA